jgi:transmembrane protein 70
MFSSFEVNNGMALFVDPRLFSHPEHYGFIMGYDKPLDFKIEEQDKNKFKS